MTYGPPASEKVCRECYATAVRVALDRLHNAEANYDRRTESIAAHIRKV